MKHSVHPGEILREEVMVELGVPAGDVAEALGDSRVVFGRVLHEHARITPNMALRLETAGVGTARGWLAMQTAFDFAQAQASADFNVRRLNPVA